MKIEFNKKDETKAGSLWTYDNDLYRLCSCQYSGSLMMDGHGEHFMMIRLRDMYRSGDPTADLGHLLSKFTKYTGIASIRGEESE